MNNNQTTINNGNKEHSLADLVDLSVDGVVAVVPLVVIQVPLHDLVADLYTDYHYLIIS